MRQDLALLESLTPLIKEVEETLAHLSTDDPWAKPMALLLQLPGVGLVTALTALAAIGDITRFPSAKKLVGYSGLGSSVSATGQTYRTGGITKQGRRNLRAVLVEAAWIAVEHHPHRTSTLRAPGGPEWQKESDYCHRPQTVGRDMAGADPRGKPIGTRRSRR